MKKREKEIYKASISWKDEVIVVKEEKAFVEGAKWADKTMIEKLRELQSGYEKDLDAVPRVYERHIQLCAKLSLIEKLIQDLED